MDSFHNHGNNAIFQFIFKRTKYCKIKHTDIYNVNIYSTRGSNVHKVD